MSGGVDPLLVAAAIGVSAVVGWAYERTRGIDPTKKCIDACKELWPAKPHGDPHEGAYQQMDCIRRCITAGRSSSLDPP